MNRRAITTPHITVYYPDGHSEPVATHAAGRYLSMLSEVLARMEGRVVRIDVSVGDKIATKKKYKTTPEGRLAKLRNLKKAFAARKKKQREAKRAARAPIAARKSTRQPPHQTP